MRIDVILIVLMCVSCSPDRPGSSVHKFLGDHAVTVLTKPERVEVYRVAEGMTKATTQPDPGTIAGYRIIDRAADQDTGFARELSAIFLSPDAYMFNAAKACLFQPDHLFRIHGHGGWVDIVTCFHCEEFVLTSSDSTGKRIHSGMEDFNQVRDRVAALAKRATGVEPYHD